MGDAMRVFRTLCLVVVLVLAAVPGWSGEERLALLGRHAQLDVARVDLDPRDPKRTRVGGLDYLGGVVLTSRDPAFGGFSSLTVVGDRITLLSDGGNIVSFSMGADWQPRGIAFANVPAGPGIGWDKHDRDSESMVGDPATGRLWVGFEAHNAIWRYSPGFTRAKAQIQPRAMADWPENGGPEAFARLPDGRFVAISEDHHVAAKYWRGSEASRLHSRDGVIFPGDPTRGPTRDPTGGGAMRRSADTIRRTRPRCPTAT
jgi:hypothetical protein